MSTPDRTERLRGRAGVAQRLRRLRAEPLCRDCRAMTPPRFTPSTTPDHIIPLTKGGTDTDDNIRCLCSPCHQKRTAEQFGFRERKAIGTDGWPIEDGAGPARYVARPPTSLGAGGG